jgi:hypothetical protein
MDLIHSLNSNDILSQWLFIKLLGLNFLFAFWSLYLQVLGLYGSKGITPIKDISLRNPADKWKILWQMPSVFWWNKSDIVIKGTALAGIVASLLVFTPLPPAPLFIILWLLYVSFVSFDRVFLSFQWDTLLLESGVLGFFYSIQSPVPFFIQLWAWTLIFRLLFTSGLVKYLSKCPAWGSFTALDYHYETQPLPNKIGYYAHQLPKIFQKYSNYGVIFFEFVVPFFFFLTPELRFIAALLTIFFQLLISFTGNYAFFNTLTISLCIPLISDDYLTSLLPFDLQITALPENGFITIALSLIGIFFILMNILMLLTNFQIHIPFQNLIRKLISHRIMSPYGLFARMTTERIEIEIQGSNDGKEWKTYEFKFKPGNILTPPKQIAPFHPRLDWQMWFLPFSISRQEIWFKSFLKRLLEGSDHVIPLLHSNPFPKPPKYIRAEKYRYHFNEYGKMTDTQEWWTRSYEGHFIGPFSL